MRSRESHFPDLPPVSPPPHRAPPKTGAGVDPDDDAETRLYQPKGLIIPSRPSRPGDTTVSARGSRSVSAAPRPSVPASDSAARSSKPPSPSAHPVTRSGPLFYVPEDLPSVRVRNDSDSEVSLMESRRPAPEFVDDEEEMQTPGLVATRTRDLTLSTRILIVAVIIAMVLLISHEAAISLHLPWLDPRRLFLKLLTWRHH
jgi:hypothetical protein